MMSYVWECHVCHQVVRNVCNAVGEGERLGEGDYGKKGHAGWLAG